MQKAKVILSLLGQKSSKNANFIFQRVYRNLFQPSFYQLAQQDCSRKLKMEVIEEIIDQLRYERYYPEPLSLEQNKGCHTDQLVQKVLCLLIEAIYQPVFIEAAIGCRKEVPIEEVLYQLNQFAPESNWVIKGKIKNLFAQISHPILLQLLYRKIADGRFIELVHRFLQAGYLKPDFVNKGSLGELSRLLAHIYLHPFDQWMNHYVQNIMIQEKVEYIRYHDEFLVWITGTKKTAIQIKQQMLQFLEQQLELTLDLNTSKTAFIHDEKVEFLGYHIVKSTNRKLLFLIPHEIIQSKLHPFMKNGQPIHFSAWLHFPVSEIIRRYHTEISGLYSYYCYADDVSKKLGKFRYYHFQSLLKTIANKEKCSVKKVLKKYGLIVSATGKQTIGAKYHTVNGKEKIMIYFPQQIKRRSIDPLARKPL
ncbi:reverse transcriptase/maturase family protein [Thermoflavimicrobium daqui]|uniref:Reverse transcriptase domain-containing protein n=1 Tax=Thermoflavimicrobium daqui TaxID=2137476 RepID=A0A364K3J0_9BACL|nr:reverse transcriptase/maturase family protein [Thermoflavimicrobium daqui]RAL23402.1 hypothetical protein DL897_11990 [Thermoflavimicrobium daqui]